MIDDFCQCPICGRLHRDLHAGSPPGTSPTPDEPVPGSLKANWLIERARAEEAETRIEALTDRLSGIETLYHGASEELCRQGSRAEKAEAAYQHLAHLLSCVAEHATGGVLSKTTYEKETYYELIDAHIEKLCQEAISEHGAEPDALAVIEAARKEQVAFKLRNVDALAAYDKAKRPTPAGKIEP